MSDYVTKDGDHVTAKGLTLTVEFGERTKAEIMAKVEEARDENAKLRELLRRYSEYTDQDRCEGCVLKRSCNDGHVYKCWQLTEIRELARELGIEVK